MNKRNCSNHLLKFDFLGDKLLTKMNLERRKLIVVIMRNILILLLRVLVIEKIEKLELKRWKLKNLDGKGLKVSVDEGVTKVCVGKRSVELEINSK